MATSTSKPDIELAISSDGNSVPAWPGAPTPPSNLPSGEGETAASQNALHALLAFSALHDQVRRRKSLAARHNGFDSKTAVVEFEPSELFVLDEVLQLVAERAVAITGADGLAIALAENNEIVLRAAAGVVRPDVGARIDRDSAFSGACFRTAQVINCDDTETDPKVNLQACRKLGARSMVAVPLCGRRRVIGVLEAFSTWPFAFNESDVRNLTLLAELVLSALKPEDEDRFAQSAQAAETRLTPPSADPVSTPADVAPATVAEVKVPKIPPARVSEAPLPAATTEILRTAASPATTPVAPALAPLPAESASTEVDRASSECATPRPADAPADTSANPDAAVQVPLFGQVTAETDSRSLTIPLVLIGVVVIAAFAAGVWWKIKTAQLGSAMVTRASIAERPASAPPSPQLPVAAPVANLPAPNTTNPDTAPDTSAENIPASAEELSKFPRVTGIRHWSSPDSSTVVLDLEDQVQYEAHRLTGPDRIYFDLRDTQLSPDLLGKSIDIGDAFVTRMRVAQPVAGMTRVVLETRPDTNFSVSLEPSPYRLIVEVRKAGTTPKGAVNLFPNAPETEKKALTILVPPPTKEDLQLRARVAKMRIVVDAGHGGWDLGTVGRRGLLEKDLVFEIAQRLGKLLESRLGADVIYTRQDDNYVPLDERAEIANQSQADLFVSVHANYSDLPSARGVETYYTNFFTAPGSKGASKDADTHAVAGATNTPTLSPADLHDRVEQSRRLASSVQRSLYGTLSVDNPGLRDRGTKEAGFVVLTETAMPGILAEVSFVSSPTDEQKLRSDGYRERIAEALYHGIARYAASSHSTKVASATPKPARP